MHGLDWSQLPSDFIKDSLLHEIKSLAPQDKIVAHLTLIEQQKSELESMLDQMEGCRFGVMIGEFLTFYRSNIRE
jgi:hypothetical protein